MGTITIHYVNEQGAAVTAVINYRSRSEAQTAAASAVRDGFALADGTKYYPAEAVKVVEVAA